MDLQVVFEKLRSEVKGKVERDVPLARFTTYRLGGPASLYIEPDGMADIELLCDSLRAVDAAERLPVLALGRGSNLVISDAGFAGAVIRLGPGFSWIEPGDDTTGTAGAAISMPQFANWAARRGLSGVEWMIAIPGSVGGGVRMNAGAHGGDMSQVLVSISVLSLGKLQTERRLAADLAFSYRRSNLSDDELVLDARFKLIPGDRGEIKGRMEAHRKHRAETQPGALQNAGSVFKNPPGDSAGRLVEAAGLKGFSVGGASVSTLHANFFIAGEGSTAQDVYDLVQEVRARVLEIHGVQLETEIRFVGEFDRGGP